MFDKNTYSFNILYFFVMIVKLYTFFSIFFILFIKIIEKRDKGNNKQYKNMNLLDTRVDKVDIL